MLIFLFEALPPHCSLRSCYRAPSLLWLILPDLPRFYRSKYLKEEVLGKQLFRDFFLPFPSLKALVIGICKKHISLHILK